MDEYKKPPRFQGLRIYFTSTLIYFLLVMPITLILLFKYSPDWLENKYTKGERQNKQQGITDTIVSDSDKNNLDVIIDSIEKKDAEAIENIDDSSGNKSDQTSFRSNDKFVNTFSLLLKLLLISFILGFGFNLPFKIYFNKKRKNKPISEKLTRFCKSFLLKAPFINVIILFISFGTIIVYMLVTLLFDNTFDEITRKFYMQLFMISLVSTILTLMFVYFWEKHRIHLKYIEFVFSKEELKKRIFKVKSGRIRTRLWTSNAMTTLLPLFIVLFYLFLSITSVKDLNLQEIEKDQLYILFGKYLTYFSDIEILDTSDFFYVNVLDSLLMFSGIFTGIFVAILYLLFFVNWTTTDIVVPVKELLSNMEATGRGELNNYGLVRTNDEIGVLTEGYNDMSKRINDYIESISRINEANARFVPKQFLEFLKKENISDIQLGDQVQKEMTILFSDIRNFTGISEQMSPRENFNFLNNYLGYMEPVIRNNHGFIDKYIGDSIMALFGNKAEDALNAAIEMRIKLVEFNEVISQFGKPPIDNGIGIHTGNLMLGVVGGEGRMDGTVISDAVNLSSRLEGLNKLYGGSIIISEDTLIRISDPSHYNYRFIDIVKVKGKKEAVYIFEVLDGESEESKILKIKTKNQFGKALQYYKSQQFEKALKIFFEVFSENPSDKAAYIYIQRCKKLIQDGVPENWDGIERIDAKYDY